jgi:YD repeat-containing protein
MKSEHADTPAPLTYRPTGGVLQDYAYGYDLAGNVLSIEDATTERKNAVRISYAHDRAPGSAH